MSWKPLWYRPFRIYIQCAPTTNILERKTLQHHTTAPGSPVVSLWSHPTTWNRYPQDTAAEAHPWSTKAVSRNARLIWNQLWETQLLSPQLEGKDANLGWDCLASGNQSPQHTSKSRLATALHNDKSSSSQSCPADTETDTSGHPDSQLLSRSAWRQT